MTVAPTRPVLRWHGGKWLLAPWIVEHMPPHRIYVEPFGGAASVLLRKQRSYAEIYNDLDEDVVTLFRVLRSRRAADLVEMIRLTPFARGEFEAAYEIADDPVERARRTIIRSFMGHGTVGALGRATGFRTAHKESETKPALDWANIPGPLHAVIERLRGVVIENRPAADVMARHDGPETLHYIDPPYPEETRRRRNRKNYRHEMTDEDHIALINQALGLRGKVMLSGYASPLYDGALSGWRRLERASFADGARQRTEVLWLNFECPSDLFSAAERAAA